MREGNEEEVVKMMKEGLRNNGKDKEKGERRYKRNEKER